ncbi:MAG: RsbRD N-terminal domain-containing protein [Holophagae bacterium]|jgi:hypothetical protein
MGVVVSQEQRAEMIGRWYDRIVDRYPAETSRFLREQRDPFANPVGAGLREEVAPIVDGMCSGVDVAELEPALDRIIRVRAVQDMTPSEAVGFVLDLKDVYESVVLGASDDDRQDFGRRIDGLLLAAFNVYSRCRQQVYDIRVKEIRNRSLKVMERLNTWREERTGGPRSEA